MTGPLADAAARAGTAADLGAHVARGSTLPRSDSWNAGRERRAEVVVVRCDERRDHDGPLGRDRFDVLERHVADELGLGELARQR